MIVRLSEADLGYLAAYLDCEGSVSGLQRPSGLYGVAISFSQRDRSALDRLREDLGMGKVYPARGSGTWSLQVARRDDVLLLVRTLYPFVRQKRTQLRLAYRIARLTGVDNRRADDFNRERRVSLVAELQRANLVGRSKPVANRNGSSRYPPHYQLAAVAA